MKQRWKRFLRGLSLKKSLVLTTVVCILLGFCADALLVTGAGSIHSDLRQTYIDPHYQGTEIRLFDESGQFITTVYRASLDNCELIPGRWLQIVYRLTDSGPCLVLSIVVASLFIFLNAWWFYRWKLKTPLKLLVAASEKIARSDLDFEIGTPGGDELGMLCASFETMRVSLKKNNEAMWRAVEERRRLNAALAHDLRTPLTVLQGYGEYLLEGRGSLTPEKTRETVATMLRNIQRLQRYTEEMKGLQALEDMRPERGKVPFQELCKQVEETGRLLLKEKFAPEFSGGGTLFLDREVFFRVCENLLSNAGRYCGERVSLALKAERDALSLTVTDDGPGFSPEGLRRAAEPYYRETGPAGDGAHSGLGLYICRVLCEKHGGTLTLSNTGGGARIAAVFSTAAPCAGREKEV